jgi:hypothetical protein
VAGRSQIKNPIKKTLDIVRKEIVPPSSPDRTSAANFRGIQGGNSLPALETEITQQGEDGDGNVITRHVFMLDIDELDDPATYLA